MWQTNKFLLSADERTLTALGEQLAHSGQAVQSCRFILGDILTTIDAKQPDILLLSESRTREQTVDMLKNISKSEKAPKIILMTDRYLPDRKEYIKHGACGILSKKATAAEIIGLAGRLTTKSEHIEMEESTASCYELELQNMICAALMELGITPRYNGYGYIRDTIDLVIHDPYNAKCISKNLYPAVAKIHGTSSSAVERSIRTAIIRSWDKIPEGIKGKYFGVSLGQFRRHPTNSEYIFILAEFIKLTVKMKELSGII